MNHIHCSIVDPETRTTLAKKLVGLDVDVDYNYLTIFVEDADLLSVLTLLIQLRKDGWISTIEL